MNSFSEQLTSFIQTLQVSTEKILPEGHIRPDEAILKLNKWLGEQDFGQVPVILNEKSTNILAREFPVIWDEKETYTNIFPHFSKDEYIEYLSNIDNSYKNLPIPNYTPTIQPQNNPNFNKNWMNISFLEVYQTIMSKNNGKDHYNLSYNNLKQTIHNIGVLHFITNCYNSILSNDFPLSSEWCSAQIVARYKGGDKTNPKNFRPIMVLPILVRIMDSIISQKLHDVVLTNQIIDTQVQRAVMKNSCGLWENAFGVNARIKEMIEENKDEIFLFIDLKNAYGSVNYRTMLYILQKYNLNTELAQYFERYYKNVTGIYQNQTFKWKNGLFQGSGLSNILFLIYIDYTIKNVFQDLKGLKTIDNGYDLEKNTYAFVDDIVMILPKNDRVGRILKIMSIIMEFYGFKINQDKTYFVINDQSIEELSYNDVTYKKASIDFKYLGYSLIIYQNKIMKDIYSKSEKCLKTIDSFNIPSRVKAYIYYSIIFLKINRIIECFYLINGINEDILRLFELVSFFAYRWNVPNFESYNQRHLEYVFAKGSAKLLKSINLKDYHKLAQEIDVEKYGIIESHNQGFEEIFGQFLPDYHVIDDSLKSLKSNNHFPIEHFNQKGSNIYSNNFVAWID